jgi:hypothetical protein
VTKVKAEVIFGKIKWEKRDQRGVDMHGRAGPGKLMGEMGSLNNALSRNSDVEA